MRLVNRDGEAGLGCTLGEFDLSGERFPVLFAALINKRLGFDGVTLSIEGFDVQADGKAIIGGMQVATG